MSLRRKRNLISQRCESSSPKGRASVRSSLRPSVGVSVVACLVFACPSAGLVETNSRVFTRETLDVNKEGVSARSKLADRAFAVNTTNGTFAKVDTPTLAAAYDIPIAEIMPLSPDFMRACGTFLGFFFLLFLLASVPDMMRIISFLCRKEDENTKEVVEVQKEESKKWTPLGICCLTAYRFYTGFMSATWLPYLVAMEGQVLWAENQSLFMGYCKLIYGATICLNPLFGLVGDRTVAFSHGLGRRGFVRGGITLAAIGMIICMIASPLGQYYLFMLGVFIWRIGEALNDVTTEALPPELVSSSQFQICSAIKAAMFLFGGLTGYVFLMVFVDIHYSWLYWAYLVMMFFCSLPPLLLLTNDAPMAGVKTAALGFYQSLHGAYIKPMRETNGFPTACFAVFVFSLGTAPMFFFLLIVRDLVRVDSMHELQMQFSLASILFFLSAAVSSVLGGMCDPKPETKEEQRRSVALRWNLLVVAILSFGLLCAVIPAVGAFESVVARQEALYVISICFGAAFGGAFSRFQDCTWQLIPQGGETASATFMGFNVMCRLVGAGLGNFVAGVLLDLFRIPQYTLSMDAAAWGEYREHAKGVGGWLFAAAGNRGHVKALPTDELDPSDPLYSATGYIILCVLCSLCTITAGFITWTIPRPQHHDVAG